MTANPTLPGSSACAPNQTIVLDTQTDLAKGWNGIGMRWLGNNQTATNMFI